MLKPKYDCSFDCTPTAHKLFWNYSEIQNTNLIDFDKFFFFKKSEFFLRQKVNYSVSCVHEHPKIQIWTICKLT